PRRAGSSPGARACPRPPAACLPSNRPGPRTDRAWPAPRTAPAVTGPWTTAGRSARSWAAGWTGGCRSSGSTPTPRQPPRPRWPRRRPRSPTAGPIGGSRGPRCLRSPTVPLGPLSSSVQAGLLDVREHAVRHQVPDGDPPPHPIADVGGGDGQRRDGHHRDPGVAGGGFVLERGQVVARTGGRDEVGEPQGLLG